MHRLLTVLTLVAGLLVACGGQAISLQSSARPDAAGTTATVPPGQATTANPAASPSATTTASPDVTAVAKMAFAKALKARNTASARLWATNACSPREWSARSLTTWKSCYRRAAKIERALADALRKIAFPGDIASDARAMIRAVAKEESLMIAVSGARDWPTLIRYDAKLGDAADATRAISNAIRGFFGMKSVG